MIEAITAGLSSLNAAASLLKTLNATGTQAAINEVKIELQDRIFEAREALAAAREANAAALERIRDLEQQIARLKDWEAEKQRYQLRDVGNGRFAYALKPGMENGQPPHSICERCYEDGHKSILQRYHNIAGRIDSLRCSRCSAEVRLSR